MTTTATRPHAPVKQSSDVSLAHKSSIRTQADRGARKRNNPFGILPARIARVEFFVEAIASLCSCEKIQRRAGNVLRYHATTREKMIQAFDNGEISIETRDRHSHELTVAEIHLGTALIAHAERICTCVIPECKNLAAQAERA